MAIHPGEKIGKYLVTRLLGRGGMGEVWAAEDPDTGKLVAAKLLLARAALKPELVRRFEREAKIANAIDNPFVCKLLEVFHTADDTPVLVFEHLAGESLADRLKREQYLPVSEVGPMIDEVLQGLVAAHAAKVIHRDLKPGNVFLVREKSGRDKAKILDFGISKLGEREEGESTLTSFDATLGSFAYMAPEQVRGAARADERADIYAIGTVVFRALSGRLPFEGTTAAVLLSLKLNRPAPTLEEVTGDKWPAGIERFLERTLQREPEKRFDTAVEALEAWRKVSQSVQSSGVGGRRVPDSVGPGAPEEATVVDDATHTVDITMMEEVSVATTQPRRGKTTTRG